MSTDIQALRAIVAAQAQTYLPQLAKLAADSPGAMGMVGGSRRCAGTFGAAWRGAARRW